MKSPIEGMTDEEYQGFVALEQQRAAQDAFDMGLTQRTPANSTPAKRLDDVLGPWFGKPKPPGGK